MSPIMVHSEINNLACILGWSMFSFPCESVCIKYLYFVTELFRLTCLAHESSVNLLLQ